MWLPRLHTVIVACRRIAGARTHQHGEAAREGLSDAQWWQQVCQQASTDARTGAVDLCRTLEPQLGRWQAPRAVSFDRERGSLRIVCHDGLPVTMATDDTTVAPALAAAADLGGLQLRLSVREPGVLQVHAVWEHWQGAVAGIPATALH